MSSAVSERNVAKLGSEARAGLDGRGAGLPVSEGSELTCPLSDGRRGKGPGWRGWARLPRRIPAALVCVAAGAVLAAAYSPSVVTSLRAGPSTPDVIVDDLSWPLMRDALLRAALPQLPLTTLNSVVSVCDLSGKLFPDNPSKPSHVATSVGLMNLVGGWFGALPCCHGAGGLAAQARFGARTGAAPVFLGIVKLVLG